MIHDLKLIVGEEKTEMLVSHQVMSNASSVFRQMFQQNRFAEGLGIKSNDCFSLPLPDDQADAMEIICNILHFRTNLVPMKDITSDILAGLATVIDKYDCALAVLPWSILWICQESIREEAKNVEDMQLSEVGKWIHISAQLGYKDLFFKSTSALISTASADDFYRDSMLLTFWNLSPTLQGKA
jgi:BTB/POZ domain